MQPSHPPHLAPGTPRPRRGHAAATQRPYWLRALDGGSLALLAAAFCWGSAIPLSKLLLERLDVATLISTQLSASLVLLLVFMLVSRTRLAIPRWRLLPPLLLVGMLEPGAAYYLEFVGLQRTSALHTALILALEPCGILLINLLFFRLRRDLALLLAMLVASAGVLLVVLGAGDDGGTASLYGDLIVFLGTMAAALYVSVSTQLLRPTAILSMLVIQQASSLALVTVLNSIGNTPAAAGAAPGFAMLLGAAGVGCLQFTLAFVLYFHGVRRSSEYWGVMVLNLAPLISVVASLLLLDEVPGPLYLIGGTVTLLACCYTRHARACTG
ncbi:MAG: DMT family transporter [Steroidobacteraceae bacterium]